MVLNCGLGMGWDGVWNPLTHGWHLEEARPFPTPALQEGFHSRHPLKRPNPRIIGRIVSAP